ncbi:hypothetical protein [Mycobacterium sp. E3305]|uniref:hypothetical protein n=1 Tax=Mycobacterium sp. E3305 TaxID=1834145 RepID=UPI0012E95D07|nr:hypothetical protein [Mycobacterium sp. E3305]
MSLATDFPPRAVVPYAAPILFGKCQKISDRWRGEVYELRARWYPFVYDLDEVDDEFDTPIDVVLRVTPRPDGGSYIRIKETGFADDWERSRALRWLRDRLSTLDRIFSDASRLQERTRQAIVVVHGIGEQLPGQTLRSFVEGVFPTTGHQRRFLKPDYTSSLFELRMMRITPDTNAGVPTTDVYELYWAHLIRDTKLGQVYGWLLRLLFARNDDIPSPLRKHFWGARLLVLAIVAGAVAWYLFTKTGQPPHSSGSHAATTKDAAQIGAATAAILAILPGLGWALLRLFQKRFLLGFLGDAARYLEPLPDNVARRREIRQAGVELLDALHDKGEYSRIIVFGHSLGSVIAYDILSLAWIRRNRRNTYKTSMKSKDLVHVENLLNPRDKQDPEPCDKEIADRQYAAWREYRRNGFEWLVSDLVTAGSPLTSATLLLNLDKRTRFKELVDDRSFPTCPPQTETVASPVPNLTRQQFTFTHAYPDPMGRGRQRSVQVPHHAGLFALVRWTNHYFPLHGVLGGDPIGGPLRPNFGAWIRDVKLDNLNGGFLGFAHGFYWKPRGNWAHIHRLKEAFALPFNRTLDDLIPEILEPEDLWMLLRRQKFEECNQH